MSHFLIPLIFGSDETPFTQLGGDKKGWPLFMSMANILSSARNATSTRAWIQLASLPTIPKKPEAKGKNANFTLTGWGMHKNDTIQETLAQILEDLPDLYDKGMKISCSDGKVRICHPIMAGWIADYKEYGKSLSSCPVVGPPLTTQGSLFQVKNNSCVNCEIPDGEMGKNIRGTPRDFSLYKKKYNQYMDRKAALEKGGLGPITHKRYKEDAKTIAAWFQARRAHLQDRIFHQDEPSLSSSNLWKPDMLHTLYEGIAKHHFGWLHGFLKDTKRLHRFNERWLAIPRYNGLTSPTKSFFQLTQRTGKEMRTAIRYLLPVLTAALHNPKPEDKVRSSNAIRCTRYLVDFILLCHYNQHTDETIALLDDYLNKYHKYKDVFLKYRAGAAAGVAIEEAERVGGDRLTDADRDRIKSSSAHFSFPKLHLLSYFSETIRKFGHLHHWSTEIVEAQLAPLKAAYRDSNKVNATGQVLAAITREYVLDVMELNIREIVRRAVIDHDATTVDHGFQPKRPEWIDDVQTTFMMYADSATKNKAALINRDFGGPAPKDEDTKDSMLQPNKPSPALPLFSPPLPLCRHELTGNFAPSNWKVPTTLKALASTYKLPLLQKSLRSMFGLSNPENGITLENMDYLHLEIHPVLKITTEAFQSQYLEVLKIRASPPAHLQRRTLQEPVYYLNEGKTYNHYGELAIGKVICLATVWVPHKDQRKLVQYISPAAYKSPTIHHIAVIQTLPYYDQGLMLPGPELGRVSYGRGGTANYKCIFVEDIVRPAHLNPIHEPSTQDKKEMQWLVNNRIDDATWDMVYGSLA